MKPIYIIFIPVLLLLTSNSTTNQNSNIMIYKDSSKTFEERTNDLISRMTLEEKIAQLQCTWAGFKETFNTDNSIDFQKVKEAYPHGISQIGRISTNRNAKEMAEAVNAIQKYFIENTRLGIPVLFHEEGLHGIMANEGVSFPQPIAIACSWNPALAQKTYEHTAKELRVRGAQHVFTPVLDVCREPRWGRVEETFGEDPFLVSQMGLAAVQGFQGNTEKELASDKVIATLKHFMAHGQPESGTNCAPANYSERILREIFLPPFKVAIEEGNALSLMASYNEIDGIPSHANKWLIQDVLRGELGFKGFIVSDYFAIQELEYRHHVAADFDEAGKLAVETGIDVETPDPVGYKNLLEMVRSGKISEETIDKSLYRVLYHKFFSGVFENPYVDPTEADLFVKDTSHRKLAYDIASESAVLLKNDGLLPLNLNKYKTIAVIGPNADRALHGGYPGNPIHNVTVLQGIKERYGDRANIVYAKGCGITEDGNWFLDPVSRTDEAEDRKLIEEAVKVAEKADIVIFAIGGNELTSREAWAEGHWGDRTNLQMVGLQDELVNRIAELKKPMVSLLFHGRPLAVRNVIEKTNALLDCWYLGQETGYVVADILSGVVNPSGKLPISIPRSVGHIPCYYNYKPTARRGYLFDEISPLYAFGYGMSYSNFQYGNPALSKSEMKAGETCEVTISVTNNSPTPGKEVVQLYIRDKVSKVTRPVKELKGFEKIELEANETKNVKFTIGKKQLEYLGIDMKPVVEPGEFAILLGSSSNSDDLQEIVLKITE